MGKEPDVRVGDAESHAAAAELESHFRAGRLDAHEYEDRRGRALDAVTNGDLEALLSDLPRAPEDVGQELASTSGTMAADRPERMRRVRDAAVALTPFVALLLFFVTQSWLWFLLIPVSGIMHKYLAD